MAPFKSGNLREVMGKKSSFFSAIKRAFSFKETDKNKGIWETRSMFSLFRGPSSIEKILGEADQLNIRPPLLLASPDTIASHKSAAFSNSLPSRTSDPGTTTPTPHVFLSSSSDCGHTVPHPHLTEKRTVADTSPPKTYAPADGGDSHSDPSPPVTQIRDEVISAETYAPADGGDSHFHPSPLVTQIREEVISADCFRHPDLDACPADVGSFDGTTGERQINCVNKTSSAAGDKHEISAIKIQAAYRSYRARRTSRASNGVKRLQGVIRGQNVRRQTVNAIKQMQHFVRVQTHIRSQRIKMVENQTLQHESNDKDKDVESSFSKQTLNQILSESAQNSDWDDSLLTKEETEAQLRKKAEAIMKRERAMAYAYSHQQLKSNPRLVGVTWNLQLDRYLWSWNWFNSQLPVDVSLNQKNAESVASTSLRASSESETSIQYHSRSYDPKNFLYPKSRGSGTPKSTKSATPFTPISRITTWSNSRIMARSLMTRASLASSTCDSRVKDDDSLMSCPQFTRPHYMAPTASAMAKVRANSNPKERFASNPDSKRRFSLPFTPDNRKFKWNKRGTSSQHHESPRSVKSSAANSTISMPAFIGRKTFNRFV